MASSPSSSSSSSPSITGAAPASSSCWCYSCDPFVHAAPHEDSIVACPDYGGVILEEMGAPPPRTACLRHPRAHHTNDLRMRRTHRAAAAAAASDRSPFNPVIVPHRSPAAVAAGDDDGAGSGLRPLPETMSDFLMGYAFERLLD
uniref:RING-type E3 ubiquitin transferase n=1 Tax=Oryza barthii TaxID=65489 RepID=A0A0D3HAU0_9ORYZ